MTWQNYEQLVKTIYESLGSATGVKIDGYGPSFKRKGKSGEEHQIDVLTSFTDGAHDYYTNIECKHWNKKVRKDVVNKVAYIRDDCHFDKAIIVSKEGFTSSAIKVAEDQHVHLVTLAEYNLEISGEKLTKLYYNLEIEQTDLDSVCLYLPESQIGLYETIDLKGFDWSSLELRREDGTTFLLKDVVQHFLEDILGHSGPDEMQSSYLPFEPAVKVSFPDREGDFPIVGVQMSGFKVCSTLLDLDYFQNRIWLLMQLLFEKKDLVFTTDGRIEPFRSWNSFPEVAGKKLTLKLIPHIKQFEIRPNPAMNNLSFILS